MRPPQRPRVIRNGYAWNVSIRTRLSFEVHSSKLRSPKSSNTSVCLFTDFDSKINVSQDPQSTVFSSNSMALDMRAVGSKSNGALRWSASTDFLCEKTFKETFYSDSEIPCDATLIEKSFETGAQTQGIAVSSEHPPPPHPLWGSEIKYEPKLPKPVSDGLRILFLKVAGFNLLMTLRLWSS
ncbi:hypothetical protein QTO34_019473 [Cnephaeus nilssonii]|uniref:T-cell receptor alpha chain constant domain-containing protein n=1 Tax=Cnephaeus nilssonii TaxID=3371016 RepID=A0AA40HWM8_CNENI|nr:hypothetical protein QTO34_019473 [Eptesicus nilssonii]